MNGITLSNKAYDVAKKVAQIWLPAFGTLYFGLAQIWGLPNPDQVVATVVAVDTFLGVLLGLSTSAYNKSDAPYDGELVTIPKPGGGKTFSLDYKGDPTEIHGKDKVTFKVVPERDGTLNGDIQ